MPEPNPVWGVHAVQGAVTAALVRRTEAGGYEILEAIAERAPSDAAGAVDAARAVLRRRGVGARGAVVALPDVTGCLVTATIPPEELDLSEHEIANEMYEWTPFEPDHAELRHLCVLREGRRQERIVTALPRADYRRWLEILEKGDLSRLGVALAGASTWRGALAMGLVPPDGFLVTTLPEVTEIFAWPQGRVRRHLLPVGAGDIARDATAIDLLARDLAQLADYHRALRRREDRPPAEPRFALAGLAAASPAIRQRLAAVLGPRLDETSPGERVVVAAQKARLPDVPLAAFAGAVGAAMEGLRPADERLVLRHVPANLPPYRERSPVALAALAVVMAAAGVGVALHVRDGEAPPAEPKAVAPAPVDPAVNAAASPSKAPDETATQRVPAERPPPPPPAETPAVVADEAGPARVRVRWPAGRDGRPAARVPGSRRRATARRAGRRAHARNRCRRTRRRRARGLRPLRVLARRRRPGAGRGRRARGDGAPRPRRLDRGSVRAAPPVARGRGVAPGARGARRARGRHGRRARVRLPLDIAQRRHAVRGRDDARHRAQVPRRRARRARRLGRPADARKGRRTHASGLPGGLRRRGRRAAHVVSKNDRRVTAPI
jgi:hypothetical protein